MRISAAIAFLLGVCATLLAVLVFKPEQVLHADALNSGGFVGVAGNAQPGARDVLWLVDVKSDTPKLCIYEVKEGRLSLIAARNVKYDFMYDQFPATRDAQTPSVQDVFKDTEKKRQEERKPPPPPAGGTGSTTGGGGQTTGK